MRRCCSWIVAGLALFLLMACSKAHYQVPLASYQDKVKVLGVMPFMVAEQPPCAHPQPAKVRDLLQDSAREQHKNLVARLRQSKAYFDVRQMSWPHGFRQGKLWRPRQLQGQGQELHAVYPLRQQTLEEALQESSVDAVLLTLLYPLERPGKVWNANHLRFLATDYCYVQYYSVVVNAQGEVLWRYPSSQDKDAPLLRLNYPDFSASRFNKQQQVPVRYLSVGGVRNALNKPAKSMLGEPAAPSQVYAAMIKELATALRLPWGERLMQRIKD